jgi:pectinesterase
MNHALPWREAPFRRLVRLLTALALILAGAGAVVWHGAGAASAATSSIVGVDSGRCLDVTGGSATAGAAVELYDCNSGANQQWEVTSAGELRVFNDTMCLDAYQKKTDPGTPVVIWTCNGGTNQRWHLNANGTITSAQSGLCLDATSHGTTNGTKLELWTCNNGTNQQWTTGRGTGGSSTVHVYVAGDSTASTYVKSLAPRTGWGQALPVFMTAKAEVVNVAKSGASSKSFIDLGRLDHILALIKPGDYLLISFGHNDEKIDDPTRYTEPSTTYKSYLSQYIDKSRAKGAIPVLITPVERRHFDGAGVISPSHGAYPAAMRELAAAKDVPLIDLTASSTALWNRAGVEGTKSYFMVLASGQYPNYPDGDEDNTHFQATGAIEVARLIATALHDQSILSSADFQRLTSTIPTSEIVWPTTAPY